MIKEFWLLCSALLLHRLINLPVKFRVHTFDTFGDTFQTIYYEFLFVFSQEEAVFESAQDQQAPAAGGVRGRR